MKKSTLLLSVAMGMFLTGCVSQGTTHNQVDELKALDSYHSAERKAEKAEQAVIVSTALLATSVLKKVEADAEVKKAKTLLIDTLNK